MKKIILLLSTILLTSAMNSVVYSQIAGTGQSAEAFDPGIIPPSPEAAAIARYGEVPVNLFRGLPNIGIPIHTLKGRDVSVPISLSYHAGGIKVSDVASWVGQGWSLNAGGMISRTVRGLPDDAYVFQTDGTRDKKGYYLSMEEIGSIDNLIVNPLGLLEQEEKHADLSFTKKVLQGRRDLQQDLYNFNFMGYSGKFYLDKTADGYQANLIPYQDIQINITSTNQINGEDRLYSWEIVTDDGMRYAFGGVDATEETINSSLGASYDYINGEYVARSTGLGGSQVNQNKFYSTWHLTKITTPNGEEINFTYRNEAISYPAQASETDEVVRTEGNLPLFGFTTTEGCSINQQDRPSSISLSFQEISTYKLSKIQSLVEEITFDPASETRRDLKGSAALGEIKVKSLFESSFYKRLTFEYGYYESDPTYNCSSRYSLFFTGTLSEKLSAAEMTYGFHRLRLDKVNEFGKAGSSVLPLVHRLAYNEGQLPPRCSYARDHFGFYNGKDLNKTLLPKVNGFESLPFGDRSFDPEKMKYGILEKIHYPTGGYTEFTYSADLEPSILPGHATTLYRVVYDEEVTVDVDNPASGGVKGVFDSKNFYLDKNKQLNVDPVLTLSVGAADDNNADETNGGTTDGPSQPTVTGTVGSVSLIHEINGIVDGRGVAGVSLDTIPLETGNYSLQALRLNDQATLKASLQYNGRREAYQSYSPGTISNISTTLRVTRIVDYDGFSHQNDRVRTFEYEDPIVARIGAGNYYHEETKYSQNNTASPEQGVYIDVCDCGAIYGFRRSVDIGTLGDISEGQIGFKRVITYYGEGGLNGHKISKFSHKESKSGLKFPFLPSTVYTWRNGLLEEEHVYDNEHVLKSSTIQKYEFQEISKKDVKVLEYTINGPDAGGNSSISATAHQLDITDFNCKQYEIHAYPLISEWVKQVETKTINYDGEVPLTVTNETFYEGFPNHILPTKRRTIQSNGLESIVSWRYPKDVISPSAVVDGSEDPALNAIAEMVSSNMNRGALEELQFIKEDDELLLIGGSLTNYQITEQGYVLPKEVFSKTLSEPEPADQHQILVMTANGSLMHDAKYISNATYEAYNVDGKVTSVHGRDGLDYAIIWNYENSVPVAQVRNALLNEIAYTSFETPSTGGWSASGSYQRTANKKTGLKGVSGDFSFSKSGLSSGLYRLTYWYQGNPFDVEAGLQTSVVSNQEIREENGWTLREVIIETSESQATQITLSGNGNLDELRLCPKNAEMTTLNYQPSFGLKTQVDVTNKTGYIFYDDFGRLSHLKDHEGNIIEHYNYHYQEQN